MAKLKKRSVAPIYAIALVWVIFTLVHPLYRVSDYVSVILLSALAFVVAKGIRPTVEYDLPDPEPQEMPEEDSQNGPEAGEDTPEESPSEAETEPLSPSQDGLPEDPAEEAPPSPDPDPEL